MNARRGIHVFGKESDVRRIRPFHQNNLQMKKDQKKNTNTFEKLSSAVSKKSGSTGAFITAVSIIIVWLVTGPLFHYSDTWQLIINTGTTVVTFLMVFLIQRSQNKESLAIQIKLNELIASSKLASNRLIDVEDLTEEELNTLERYYSELVKMSKKQTQMRESHSIEEAIELSELKLKQREKLG